MANGKVHAEIEYEGPDGRVHSDICPRGHHVSGLTPEYRAFLHDALDEWLDNSNGTGRLHITEEGFSSG